MKDEIEIPEYDTAEYEVFNTAIEWTIGQLQSVLGVKEWFTSGGGTETLDGDVRSELHDLLKAAGRDDDSIATLKAENARLLALVRAVKSSEFEGISCEDVIDGKQKNWFDLRTEITGDK